MNTIVSSRSQDGILTLTLEGPSSRNALNPVVNRVVREEVVNAVWK